MPRRLLPRPPRDPVPRRLLPRPPRDVGKRTVTA